MISTSCRFQNIAIAHRSQNLFMISTSCRSTIWGCSGKVKTYSWFLLHVDGYIWPPERWVKTYSWFLLHVDHEGRGPLSPGQNLFMISTSCRYVDCPLCNDGQNLFMISTSCRFPISLSMAWVKTYSWFLLHVDSRFRTVADRSKLIHDFYFM